MSRIDRSLNEQDKLARAGSRGQLAALMAGVLDPINFIPVAGVIGKAVEGGRLLRFAVGAAETAALGAVAANVQEGVLHQLNPVLPPNDPEWTTIIGAALGGALGGASTLLTRAEFIAIRDAIARRDFGLGRVRDWVTRRETELGITAPR